MTYWLRRLGIDARPNAFALRSLAALVFMLGVLGCSSTSGSGNESSDASTGAGSGGRVVGGGGAAGGRVGSLGSGGAQAGAGGSQAGSGGGITGSAGDGPAGSGGDTASGLGGSSGMGGSTSAAGGGGAIGAGGSTGAGGSIPHTGSWRIMPLGDSITGTTCYPQLLSKELIANGHTDFTFVGKNLNNQSCGSDAPSLMTEGHGGYDVTYLTTNSPPQSGHGTLAELESWTAETPDVVLMEYATNDVWNGYSISSILAAYSFVVDQFRSQKPDVVFFVAQITPLHPSGCTACESNVETLNAMIPSWAAGKTSASSPIYVVDVWAALPEASYLPNSQYTSDGVHPNPAGAQLVANAWYTALVAKGVP
jgi:lysophospholipase L1-like esterase